MNETLQINGGKTMTAATVKIGSKFTENGTARINTVVKITASSVTYDHGMNTGTRSKTSLRHKGFDSRFTSGYFVAA